MTFKDQMGVGFNFQIFLEVGSQRRQRLLLAGKQSAIWILNSRLRGWEINTVKSKPGFQSLLFGRRPGGGGGISTWT